MHALPPYLVAVDVGNSAAKVAVATPDDSPRGWRWIESPQRLDSGGDWNDLTLPEERLVWAVSSVRTGSVDRLRGWLQRRRPDDALLEWSSRDVPLRMDVRLRKQVGVDRVVGATAAMVRWNGQSNGVVVLAGTAITVNLLVGDSFQGGAILPGFDLALRSLFEGTSRLPDLAGRLHGLVDLPGVDTESAIQAGVGWGTVGAVREIGSRLTAGLPESKWIVSGGNAELIAEGLGFDVEVAPALVLEGVVETFLRSRRKTIDVTSPVASEVREPDEPA